MSALQSQPNGEAVGVPRHVVWTGNNKSQAKAFSALDWAKGVVVKTSNDHSNSIDFDDSEKTREESQSHSLCQSLRASGGPVRVDNNHQVFDLSGDRSKDTENNHDSISDEDEKLNSDDPLPSLGSKDHNKGICSPCFFVHTHAGCHNGEDCEFCHMVHKRKNKPKPCKKKRDRYRKLRDKKEKLVEQDPDALDEIAADLPLSIQQNPQLKNKLMAKLESAANSCRATKDDGALPRFGVQASINSNGQQKHIVATAIAIERSE